MIKQPMLLKDFISYLEEYNKEKSEQDIEVSFWHDNDYLYIDKIRKYDFDSVLSIDFLKTENINERNS